MPRRKPNPEKVLEQKIKESLDSIILEEVAIERFTVDTKELPRMKPAELMNFADEKLSALSEAQSLMQSMTDFYVETKTKSASELLEMKQKMDALNISSMMFQMKTAQHAVVKILEEIEMGTLQPKLFEVLTQLQTQLVQMPKYYQQYMEKMEAQYKNINEEITYKLRSGNVMVENEDGEFTTNNQDNNNSIKSRGTRSIMESLREVLGTEIIDIKAIEVSPNAVVNAREKLVIDPELRPECEGPVINDEEDMIIEDDLLG